MAIKLGDIEVDVDGLESMNVDDVTLQQDDHPNIIDAVDKKPSICEQLGYTPTIVFCVPGKMFSNMFLQCWSNTMLYCSENKFNFVMSNNIKNYNSLTDLDNSSR